MVESIEAVQTDDEAKQALVKETFEAPYKESAESLQKYAMMVEETIDLEELDKHNCVIKAEYDPKLSELSKQLSDVRCPFLKIGTVHLMAVRIGFQETRCRAP